MIINKLFLIFGLVFIACVRGSTFIERFDDNVLIGFTSMDYPFGATHYTGIFNLDLYVIETRTLNSTFMEFEITAATTGWVGLILNPTRAALSGGDVIIAGVHNDSGMPYYTDMHGDSNSQLTADTKTESDWILVSADETTNPPQTKFVFHRRYNTTDPNVAQDYSIMDEPVWYIAIMSQYDDPFPILVNENAVGTSRVNFVIGGTGGADDGGNGACGLIGSFAFVLTLASIAVFEMF